MMLSLAIHQAVDFKLFRKGMIFAMAILILLGLPWFFWTGELKEEKKLMEEVSGDPPFDSAGMMISNDRLLEYETRIGHSSFFGYRPKPEADQAVSFIKSNIRDLTKDLRLKGVVILSDPEAILEDASSQKSFFVKKGDSVGELIVRTISNDSLTLGYQNEETTLRIQS